MEKTIKAKLDISSEERELLQTQWDNWNKAIRGKQHNLYSVHEQQIDWKNIDSEGHPVILRNDKIQLKQTEESYAVKLRHCDVYGGFWVPMHVPYRYHDLLEEAEICNSQLRPENGDWYIHLSIRFETSVPENPKPDVVIGVDLGERHLATSTALVNGKIVNPEYHHGRESREIRAHYHRLRKNLQRKKAWNALQRIAPKEGRALDDLCHKVSREIIDKAQHHEEQNREVAIAVGDLGGIREQDWGSKGNRKKDSFPFYKLKQYIAYKAEEADIYCEFVDEAYTSQTCNRCGHRGSRSSQGCFRCTHDECEITEYNADMNAAINIGSKLSRKLRKPLWEQQGGIDDAPKPAIQT